MKAHVAGLVSLGILTGSLTASKTLAATFETPVYAFNNLVTGSQNLAPVYSTFTFPKFDSSLGTLQSIQLDLNFSGVVNGTATGVTGAGIINHAVFFGFVDTFSNISIAEPNLILTKSISSSTMTFGPQFQSTALSFSVTGGDPRFEAWRSGPGDVSVRLGVYFSNYVIDPLYGLRFYNGADSGTYNGSFAIAYNYTPVPEPSISGLAVATMFLLGWMRKR